MSYMSVGAFIPAINDGKLRAIAIASKLRSPALPDVPTLAEVGVLNHETEFMVGVVVPTGTPKDVIEILHRELARIASMPDVKERLAALGFDAVGSSPDTFAAKIKADYDKWSDVVQKASIQIQ